MFLRSKRLFIEGNLMSLWFLLFVFFFFCIPVHVFLRANELAFLQTVRTHTRTHTKKNHCVTVKTSACIGVFAMRCVNPCLLGFTPCCLCFFFFFKKGKREEEALLRGAKLVSAVHMLCCVSYFTVVILPFPLVPFFFLTETKNERLLTSTQGASTGKKKKRLIVFFCYFEQTYTSFQVT